MNWITNSTIETIEELERREEEEIGYYQPKHKIAVIIGENSHNRGHRSVYSDALFVYMYDTSDYKGDLFMSCIYGNLDENQEELYDYLLTTGKFIQ